MPGSLDQCPVRFFKNVAQVIAAVLVVERAGAVGQQLADYGHACAGTGPGAVRWPAGFVNLMWPHLDTLMALAHFP